MGEEMDEKKTELDNLLKGEKVPIHRDPASQNIGSFYE